MDDDDKEFVALIEAGRETRRLEYKRSCAWNDLKLKIAKTAMAMANTRDGGTIIIGVSEDKKKVRFVPEGMSQNDIASYNQDDINSFINSYADPSIQIALHQFGYDGKDFLALSVEEFEEIPVVCKKNGQGLREGAIYVRSRRKIETAEILSQTEMRDLMDLASEKGVRHFVTTARRAGISLEETMHESDSKSFDEELRGL